MNGVINMNSNTISNLPTPTTSDEAANKSYVDTQVSAYLPLSGGNETGNIVFDGVHTVTGLPNPVNS